MSEVVQDTKIPAVSMGMLSTTCTRVTKIGQNKFTTVVSKITRTNFGNVNHFRAQQIARQQN